MPFKQLGLISFRIFIKYHWWQFMTNWIANTSWLGSTILILAVLVVERVFGPPVITLWLLVWLMGNLKLSFRFWFTFILATLGLAISYNLGFGISSLIVAGLSILAHQQLKHSKFWLGLGVVISSGLICWLSHLNLRYYGAWLVIVGVGVIVWWTRRSSSRVTMK